MNLPEVSRSAACLDAAIDKALAEKRVVGTVVLVAREGEVVYSRAAGFADREAATPMREDAIFRLASITKPYMTAAVLRCVEEGKLDLAAPVTRWLPDFHPALPDGEQPEITIRQLLTHTSGLGYRFFEPPESPYHRLNVSDGVDQPGLSLKENLARLVQAPLLYAPGKGWRYSLGLDVLGAVLEAVEGRGLAEILRETVTGPLGMTDTDFSAVDPARLVTPYADGEPEPAPIRDGQAVPLFGVASVTFAPSRIFNPASYPSGGGGMAGTAGDVLRFLEAIRRGGAPILQPATVEAMASDQIGMDTPMLGPGWGFGYGWAVLKNSAPTATPQEAGTLQWGGVYGHSWFLDRANGLAVAALTNTAVEGMSGRFPFQIRDAVYGL